MTSSENSALGANLPYTPPKFEESAFNCPNCGAYAQQKWTKCIRLDDAGKINIAGNRHFVMQLPLYVAICSHCDEPSYWIEEKLVYPSSSNVPLPNIDIPENCRKIYFEAADVLNKSPKSAAALLRLCLQMLMKELGEKGKNINEDIEKLVKKGLPADVIKALEICRIVGNHAAHPGQIEWNDNAELAQGLFSLINFIVTDRISNPKALNQLFEQLPAKDLKKTQDKYGNALGLQEHT